MELLSIGYALLATQNALLRVVTPELRAVVIDVCHREEIFYIRVYYDGAVSEKWIDLWQCMTAEVDLGICKTDEGIERLDYPAPIPLGRGTLAYLRKELDSRPSGRAMVFGSVKRTILREREDVGVFTSPLDGLKIATDMAILQEGLGRSSIIPARPSTYPIPITPVAYALLGLQKALLGVVVPELRSVMVDVVLEGRMIYIRFYYEGFPPEDVLDSWESAITSVSAAMGSEYVLDGKVEKIPYPQAMPFRGRYAYMRFEERVD